MHFNLFLLLIVTMLAFSQGHTSIFDYKQVAPCARSCKIITTSELNCVPPAAPISNNATYVDCFCQSEYLKSFYRNGETCHHVCSNEDDLTIYHYYNALCGMPRISSPSSSPTLSSPSSFRSRSSSPTGDSKSLIISKPTEAPPAPSADSQHSSIDHGAWLHRNWKYFIVAGSVILVAFAIVFSFGFLYRRHRRKNNVERSNTSNGLIPLQLLSPPDNRLRIQRSRDDWPPESLENLPSPVPASPLAPSGSTHTFAASLKFYAQEIREREKNVAKRLPRNDGQLSRR